MSKASELRAKQGYEKASRLMNSKTLVLRERYYESTVRFHTSLIKNNLDSAKKKLAEATDSYSLSGLPQSIARLEKELARKLQNQLMWVGDAKISFDNKLQKVSQKLVEFGLADGNMKVEDTWIETSQEMSFVISSTERVYRGEDKYLGSAHARLIWVNCTEKASHWRFITTLKDKPGTIANPTEECSITAPILKGSRSEQVAKLLELDYSAKKIAETLEMNVSYVRTIIRKLR